MFQIQHKDPNLQRYHILVYLHRFHLLDVRYGWMLRRIQLLTVFQLLLWLIVAEVEIHLHRVEQYQPQLTF